MEHDFINRYERNVAIVFSDLINIIQVSFYFNKVTALNLFF